MLLSVLLLSAAKLINFVPQIMAKDLECSREVMAWLPCLTSTLSYKQYEKYFIFSVNENIFDMCQSRDQEKIFEK